MRFTRFLMLLLTVGALALCLCACDPSAGLPHDHKFVKKVAADEFLAADASCIVPRLYYYSCICGEHSEDTFRYGEPRGHLFGEYTVKSEATCTRDATEWATCTACGETDEREVDDTELGHSFVDYVSNGDATCGADGTESAKCERCKKIDTRADEGSMLPHTYSNEYSKNETHHWYDAICGHEATDGEEKHTFVNKICEKCQYIQDEAIIESIKDAEIHGTDIDLLTKAGTLDGAITELVCSVGATYEFYSDADCTMPLAAASALADGSNTAYIKVVSANGKLTRIYTVSIYKSFSATVSFEVDGQTVHTVAADTGYLFSTDYAPAVKTGYRFLYWMLGEAELEPMILYGDITLSAVCEPKSYTVTFDTDGADVTPSPLTVTYGAKYTLYTPGRLGYEFKGWYDADGKKWDISGIWQNDGGITLIAKWEKSSSIELPFRPQ